MAYSAKNKHETKSTLSVRSAFIYDNLLPRSPQLLIYTFMQQYIQSLTFGNESRSAGALAVNAGRVVGAVEVCLAKGPHLRGLTARPPVAAKSCRQIVSIILDSLLIVGLFHLSMLN